MLGPQRISLHIQPDQERSYSESALPLTMSVANRFKVLLEPRLKSIPRRWSYDDRILVLLAPNLTGDVKKFHDSQGPSFDEMFASHQIQHLDESFVKLLGDLLDVSILESMLTGNSPTPAQKSRTRMNSLTKKTNGHWTTVVGKDTWFAMAHWAKENNKLSSKARNFLYNVGTIVASERNLTQAQEEWAKQLFQIIMIKVFDVKEK